MRKGRIRLNMEQADILTEILSEYRHRLVARRADARDKGEDLSGWQERIQVVSSMQDELDRTSREMGWISE
jgi:hypothetical protein